MRCSTTGKKLRFESRSGAKIAIYVTTIPYTSAAEELYEIWLSSSIQGGGVCRHPVSTRTAKFHKVSLRAAEVYGIVVTYAVLFY